jgi:tetratricopeptide (TPR) repeat protein
MSGIRQLIQEIHRRSLWQVLGIYIAGSWLALQAADTLTASMGLPDWVPQLALVLLLVLLPVVLATAFVQEGARPADRKRESEGAAAEVDVQSGSALEGAVETDRRLPPEQAGFHFRLFTWHNALLAAAGAFAVLGAGTSGYVASRALGIGPAATLISRGVLEERDKLVLTDFENATRDSLLGDAVTELLRIDLLQSPTIDLVEAPQIAGVLQRMERDPSETLTEELGLELARREGIKALIAGEVRSVGIGYVLAARLLDAGTGETLVPLRVTASDSTKLMPAMDRLSRQLRERVGESLRSIQAAEPLANVSTGSLAALRKYTQALRADDREGDWVKAAALYDEAITLDSTFAMAHRKLGISGRISRARQVEALTRAYELRDRLVERERLMAEGSYHANVSGDWDRAIQAYQSLLAAHPDEVDALNNLSVLMSDTGELETAVRLLRRAIEVGPANQTHYTNLVLYLADLGKIDETEAVLREGLARFPDNMIMRFWRVGGATMLGEYDVADSLLTETLREFGASPNAQITALRFGMLTDAARGQLVKAEAKSRDLQAVTGRLGLWGLVYGAALNRGEWSIWARGSAELGTAEAEAVLAEYPLAEIDPLDRPYLDLAIFFGHAGNAERAAAFLREYEAEVPTEFRGGGGWMEQYTRAQGVVALARGNLPEAIRSLEEAKKRATTGSRLQALSELALVYDRAGDKEAAITAFEAYLERPWATRILGDHMKRAYFLERLAQLWANADEDLQPRVRDAQARLEEIVRERG